MTRLTILVFHFFLALLLVTCGENPDKKQTAVEQEVPRQWLTFESSRDGAPHIVLVSGDEEYRSEEALPQLAKILSERHGFNCTVLFAQDPENPGFVDANYTGHIPGLEALDTADLMVLFTRFRALPDDEMTHLDTYLKRGRPVLGIRTATHAFMFPSDSMTAYQHYSNGYEGEKKEWTGGFGRLVLGEKWIAHHGHHKHQSTRGVIAEGAENHPIVSGIQAENIWGPTDVYEVRLPLPGDSQPVVLGQVIDREGDFVEQDPFFGMKPTDSQLATVNNAGRPVNDTLMPIAWTKSYQIPGGSKGKVFTSTIGSSTDLLNEGVRRLLVNACFWLLDEKVPEKTDVGLVGDYSPTAFEFRDDAYWDERQLKVVDLR